MQRLAELSMKTMSSTEMLQHQRVGVVAVGVHMNPTVKKLAVVIKVMKSVEEWTRMYPQLLTQDYRQQDCWQNRQKIDQRPKELHDQH